MRIKSTIVTVKNKLLTKCTMSDDFIVHLVCQAGVIVDPFMDACFDERFIDNPALEIKAAEKMIGKTYRMEGGWFIDGLAIPDVFEEIKNPAQGELF